MEGTPADDTGPVRGNRSDGRPPEGPKGRPGGSGDPSARGPGAEDAGDTSKGAGGAGDTAKGSSETGEGATVLPGAPIVEGRVRTGRDLPAAIGVGLALGAAVLVSLYTVKILFLVLLVACVGIGVVEMTRAFAVRDIRVPVRLVLPAFVAMMAAAYWGGPIWLLGAFTLTVLALLTARMFQGQAGYVRDAAAGVLVAVYPALLAGFVPLMLSRPDGADRVVIFIAVTVCSDIGGYFAGILFGRRPMSAISPKKTWEGFAGSVAACVACGAILVRLLLDGHYWQGAVIGVVVAACATLGDLVESVIKRDLGIKDMGSILPGHGGLMDRLDSLLATLVPVWLLLAVFIQV